MAPAKRKAKTAQPRKKGTASATEVSPVRLVLVNAVIKQPEITVDELAKKLAASGHELTEATTRTMAYHVKDTIRALMKAGMLKTALTSCFSRERRALLWSAAYFFQTSYS